MRQARVSLCRKILGPTRAAESPKTNRVPAHPRLSAGHVSCSPERKPSEWGAMMHRSTRIVNAQYLWKTRTAQAARQDAGRAASKSHLGRPKGFPARPHVLADKGDLVRNGWTAWDSNPRPPRCEPRIGFSGKRAITRTQRGNYEKNGIPSCVRLCVLI